MTKIALINPGTNQKYADTEPLCLGYLAAYLESNGAEVKIIDQLAGADVAAELEKFRPQFVGVTATTPVAPDAYAILDYARSKKYTTVMGGVHASVMPDEALNHSDYVVVGEGEKALLAVVNGGVKDRTVKGGVIRDLDEIPPPARHLMDADFYYGKKHRIPAAYLFFLPRNPRLASVITSRGCPFNCIFCHNSWRGIPVRYNSPQRVISEISGLMENYGINSVTFADDDLLVNKSRFRKICEELIKMKSGLVWAANARVSSVDKESLELAREAGCRQICFGVESGSQKILDVFDKRYKVEQAENAIKMTKSAGLFAYSTFMIGSPTETREDIRLTKEFILRNKLDSIGITITTPFPGTKLWDWCKERRLLPDDIDWKNFNLESCRFPANENFTREEIEKMRSEIILAAVFGRKAYFLFFYMRALFYYPKEIVRRALTVLLPLLMFRKRKKSSPAGGTV